MENDRGEPGLPSTVTVMVPVTARMVMSGSTGSQPPETSWVQSGATVAARPDTCWTIPEPGAGQSAVRGTGEASAPATPL
jgi:hypothetical protein